MSNSQVFNTHLVLAVAILMFSVSASAQFGASIEGTVQDNSGAVVAGAAVTVTNQGTGTSFTAQSSPTGVYRVSGLTPGMYTVAVQASSFAQQTLKDVQVEAEAPRGLNVQLSPEQATQSVTVTASGGGASLQTEDADVSGSISAQEVQQLPQFGNDPYELLRLSPGVFGVGAQQANGAGLNLPNTTGPGSSAISIFQTENQVPISANGQRLSSNDYLIDGVSVNSQTWGGAAVITPNDDAVQEMRVTSATYAADTGRNSGATVQVVTKTGTNNFHGDAFFLYQDPGLNAYDGWAGPVSLNGTTTKVEDKWREYGGSVGGPILKNHLFFFASYEGLHSFNTTYSTPTYIFTPEFNQLAGSVRPNSFVNTMLNAPNSFPRVAQQLTPSCAQFVTANWPCQIVNNELDIGSPSGSDRQYVPVFGSNPALQAGGGPDGIPDLEYARLAEPVTNIPNQYNARLDYVTGPHQISWTGLMSRGDQTTYTLSTAPAYDLHYSPLNGATTLAWVWNITPTWLNDLRGNATRWAYNELNKNTGVNWGLPYVYVQNMPGGVPNINISPASSTETPADFAENTFEVRDTATRILGRHAIKFGGEVRREQNNDNLAGGDRPAYAFAGPWNLFNDTPIYEGIYINPATGGLAQTQRYFRTGDYALFVQDDFKLTPNLTLNVGLRWEYFTPLTEKYGNLSNLVVGSDPTTGLLDAVAERVSQYTNPDWNNFAPRFGFAWSPSRFNNKTVLRGGVGMAYDRVYDGIITPSREDPPGASVNFGLCCGTAGPPADGFGTPFDSGLIVLGTSANSIYDYPVSPNLSTLMPLGPNNLPVPGAQLGGLEIYGAPRNFPNPYVWIYSLEVQQELPQKLIFTVGYQGSQTRKELRLLDQNFVYAKVNPGISNAYFATPDVNGNFNALNANLRRNYKNLQFAFNYRWSKSLDDLSYGGPGAVTNQTYPQNQNYEYGPSDYDTTNYANGSVVYRLPFFDHRSNLLGEALGGWTVSGIATYNSGLPWTPVSTQSCLEVASQCLSPYRPTAVLQPLVYSNSVHALETPGVNFPGGGPAYFNQTPGIPAVGRNSLRGPSFRSVDLSLAKMFRVNESANLELRADAFNIFNITNLSPFNFGDSNTVINNPVFGQGLTATAGRVLELEGRFRF